MSIYITKGMKADIDTNIAFALEELVDLIEYIGSTDDVKEAVEILKDNKIKFEEVE